MPSNLESGWQESEGANSENVTPDFVLDYLWHRRERLYAKFYSLGIDGYLEKLDSLHQTDDDCIKQKIIFDIEKMVDSFFDQNYREAALPYELMEIQDIITSIIGIEIAIEAIQDRLAYLFRPMRTSIVQILANNNVQIITVGCLLKISAMFLRNDYVFHDMSVRHAKSFITRQPFDGIEIDFLVCKQRAINYIADVYCKCGIALPWEINNLTHDT